MTREEQKFARELKKPLAKTCKEIGKKRGRGPLTVSDGRQILGVLYYLNNTPQNEQKRAFKLPKRAF